MMDYLKALGELMFIIWALFMLNGTAIIMSSMMWNALRDIFKGEW